MGWFCPDEFELSERSKEFARKKGLTDEQIEDELEAMRDYEYARKRTDWDRAFRNWVRKGIEWGRVTPVRRFRRPEQVSEEQRQQDIEKWRKDMERMGVTDLFSAKSAKGRS